MRVSTHCGKIVRAVLTGPVPSKPWVAPCEPGPTRKTCGARGRPSADPPQRLVGGHAVTGRWGAGLRPEPPRALLRCEPTAIVWLGSLAPTPRQNRDLLAGRGGFSCLLSDRRGALSMQAAVGGWEQFASQRAWRLRRPSEAPASHHQHSTARTPKLPLLPQADQRHPATRKG